MQKKIKIAKSRDNSVEVENDLRGFGETSLFQDLSPEPTLTVKGSYESQLELARSLNLQEVGSSTDLVHLICAKRGLSYKEKSLNLLAFALKLKTHSKTNSHLWQKQNFHAALRESLGAKELHADAGNMENLTIDPAIQLHLHQAGFSIQPSDKNQTLNSDQVRQLWNEITSPKSVARPGRKVG